MRFKKLKIFVEIAIIIFILVAGNVIVFGLIQGKQSSKVKNPSLELPVVTIEKENPIVQKQKGEGLVLLRRAQKNFAIKQFSQHLITR